MNRGRSVSAVLVIDRFVTCGAELSAATLAAVERLLR